MTDQEIENAVARVSRLYAIIVNGELGDDENGLFNRVCIVRELEKITGKQFRDTAEFHREVSAFLAKKSRISESVGTQIRRARIRAGLTMKSLAKELKVSMKMVQRWELNVNGYVPNPSVIEWLNKSSLDAKVAKTTSRGKED
jgi:ribosome-binding protein aMBF1 (putative translation factor)